MTTSPVQRGDEIGIGGLPPVRELLAGALLAAIGLLGIFVPMAAVAALSSMMSHGPMGFDQLLSLPRLVAYTPAVCVAALVAAVGLYREASWGRRMTRLTAALLVAGPFVGAVAGAIGLYRAEWEAPSPISGQEFELVRFLLWHVFLAREWAVGPAHIAALVGVVVLWGLARGVDRSRRQTTSAGEALPTIPVRRPNVAMLWLIFIGVDSLIPYVSWLGTRGVASVAEANGIAPGPASTGPDPIAGILIAIPTAIASISALAAARAIRSRASYGPYLAPAAAAIAGPWAATWLATVGGRLLSPDVGHGDVSPVLAGLGLIYYVIVLAAALAFFPVTVSVIRRRSWFFQRSRVPERPTGRYRTGRFWSVAGGLGAVMAIPLVIGSIDLALNPPPPTLYYREVLLDRTAYRYAAPIIVDESSLQPMGRLAAWTADLTIEDPGVLIVPGVAPEDAIVVRGWPEEGDRSLGVFVPSHGDTGGSPFVPSVICPMIQLDLPDTVVDPCGPPLEVQLDDMTFHLVTDDTVRVDLADVSPSGRSLSLDPAVDARVSPQVHAIAGVPLREALVLLVGERVLLYVNRPEDVELWSGGALCRYSPGAVENPLGTYKSSLEPAYGCDFPEWVDINGRVYQRVGDLDNLFVYPSSVLTPIGTAFATVPEVILGSPRPVLPFPSTVDATAYRVEGISETEAVVFLVGDQTVLALPVAEEGYVAKDAEGQMVLPTTLCVFLDPVELESKLTEGYDPMICQ